MNRLTMRLFLFLFSSFSFGAPLIGVWESDCQNMAYVRDPFQSQKPVDTFYEDGTASLRIHVFEKKNCTGKEWDMVTIPCNYTLGKKIVGLPNTRELDLRCVMEGQNYAWYEIAESTETTLRYGKQTGNTPEERPKELGSIFYHRLSEVK